MCGFSGIFRWDSKPVEPALLKRMTDTLVHRGPDDEGYYFNQEKEGEKVRVGLGFRRLAIIDLSGGHQPMSTAENQNWIVFNGEIYNFIELRKDLEKRGCKFLTRSDTEVILHLYEIYGKDCARHLRGMFAFVIWDSKKRSLFLARDRIGKKPLFYSRCENAFYFASEMKALIESQEISQKIRLQAVPLYLAYQFIPSPITIYEAIQRLPPAHTLICDEHGNLKIEKYWTISRTPQTNKPINEICEELQHRLREATRIRLISDVPLGAFLSGGIDSSAVVGMMAEETSAPVKTFSIGFEESDFSELEYARLVARRFRTDHHEFIVKPEMVELLPKLVWHYDQPFADPSALPSYSVAHETRKFVTVALNGDGGDENFAGYLRYQADRIFQIFSCLPASLRSLCARSIQKTLSAYQGNHFFRRFVRAGTILDSTPHEFNFKLFCYFDSQSEKEIFDEPLLTLSRSKNVSDYFSMLYAESDSKEFMDQVLACDASGYLPDCLLVKMDIASMANSLETRSPFLDHQLIEFAAKIPAKHKVKFNGGKWILKRALKNFLPEKILYRRKMGFGVPLSKWFRGPLKMFLKEVLLDNKARQRGYFKIREIERLVQEHQSCLRDHGYKLWALLMFELWHKVYVDKTLKPQSPSRVVGI